MHILLLHLQILMNLTARLIMYLLKHIFTKKKTENKIFVSNISKSILPGQSFLRGIYVNNIY